MWARGLKVRWEELIDAKIAKLAKIAKQVGWSQFNLILRPLRSLRALRNLGHTLWDTDVLMPSAPSLSFEPERKKPRSPERGFS
jgi:hypothetical protein